LHEIQNVSNYDPLRDFLKKQTRLEFSLTFEEIEEILGFALPRASHRASWWETMRSPQVAAPQRVACYYGGYIAIRASDSNGVRFKRLKSK
jgi:hypothetical protein